MTERMIQALKQLRFDLVELERKVDLWQAQEDLLFSAAPEMLAALRAVEEAEAGVSSLPSAVANQVRAAITKADARAPIFAERLDRVLADAKQRTERIEEGA